MTPTIIIKRGDTLVVKGNYKQDNDSMMNLAGYTLEVNILNSETEKPHITLVSTQHTSNRSVLITNEALGEFLLVMKDTEVLSNEDYWLDFKVTSTNGYEQTSKALKLKVRNRLS